MCILAKMLSRLTMCIYLILVCVLGAITFQYTILVPFIFVVIYGCSYLFWKANGHKFPYYFHISLMFLIANNQVAEIQAVVDIVKWGLVLTFVVLAFTLINLRKNQTPLLSDDKIIQGTIDKYSNFFKENPSLLSRTFIHCLVVFCDFVDRVCRIRLHGILDYGICKRRAYW